MSPYASELAGARLDALRTLIDALNEAETPDEKRRCAVAIFNAPDPCDLDDEIEFEDDDDAGEQSEDDSEVDEDSQEDEDSDDHEEAATPAPHPRSTSDIAHPTSNISPDILAGLSDQEIIAKAKALLDSGAFNHILAPSG